MSNKDIKTRPCLGCSYCCMEARCVASVRLYPAADVCPALRWDEVKKRHTCELMLLPGKLGEIYREELCAGAGCCSNLNTWRKEIKNRLEPDVSPPVVLDKYLQIFLNCLGGQFMGMDGVYLAIMQLSQVLLKEGVPEDTVNQISQTMMHYLKGNRRSMMKDFFGD